MQFALRTTLVLLLLCITYSRAMVHHFGGEVVPSNELSWLLVGMYSGSTVDLNMTISRTDFTQQGHVETLLLHEDDLVFVGIHTPYTIWLCCDEEVHQALQSDDGKPMYNMCGKDEVGYTALTTNALKYVRYELTQFEENVLSANVQLHYTVPREGLYYIIVINCNGSHAGELQIRGTAAMKGPSGFLTGGDANYIPLYGALSASYGFAFIAWVMLLYWRSSRFMLLHQGGMAAILVVGSLQYMFSTFDLITQNASGELCVACTVVAVFFMSMFATMLRVYILLIALGFGVISPISDGLETPRAKYAMVALSVGYFCFYFVQNVVGTLTDIPDSSGRKVLLLLLPLNILNSCFYVWTFLELIRSVHRARDDGDRDKFNQFLSHLILFLSLTGIALFVAIVQMIVQWRNVSDVTWTFQWLFGGSWDLMMFVVLLIFALLWQPSSFTHGLVYRDRGPLEWRRQPGDGAGAGDGAAPNGLGMMDGNNANGNDEDRNAANGGNPENLLNDNNRVQ